MRIDVRSTQDSSFVFYFKMESVIRVSLYKYVSVHRDRNKMLSVVSRGIFHPCLGVFEHTALTVFAKLSEALQGFERDAH